MKTPKKHTKKLTKNAPFTQKKNHSRDFSQDTDEKSQYDEIVYGKHAILAILAENKQINKVFVQKGLTSNGSHL